MGNKSKSGVRSYATKAGLKLAPLSLRPPARRGDLAILVPIPDGRLDAEAKLSLATLARFAGDTPIILLKKSTAEITFPVANSETVEVPAPWMDSLSAYNALMMEAAFYEAFLGFDNILIFQLDCLLLGSDFRRFTDAGLSYWGAPYFRRNGQLKSVGNGGFSLRRPRDCLSVLTSERLSVGRVSPSMLRQYLKGAYLRIWTDFLVRGRDRAVPLGQAFCDAFPRAEDEFWIFYAPAFSPQFRLATALQAVAFAAESQPRRVVELNGGALPLGVHAWARHDRPFWEEVLRREGLAPDKGG